MKKDGQKISSANNEYESKFQQKIFHQTIKISKNIYQCKHNNFKQGD